MTESEAGEFYEELLHRFHQAGASNLVEEIKSTVRRGRLSVAGAKGEHFQHPLSASERLAVALRLFVAAIDSTFQIDALRGLAPKATGVVVVPDIPDWALEAGAAPPDFKDLEVQAPNSLVELKGAITELSRLIEEFEAEVERGDT